MASARYDYLTEHEAEQTAKTLEQLESQKDNDKGYQHGNACTHKQLNSSGYFGQENVQEFQKEMVSHLFGKDAPKKKGRGMFFDTKEEIDEWIEKYFGVNKKKLERAERFVKGRGAWMAFFMFIPFLGEAIGVVLGLMRANAWITAIAMFLGKSFRYIAIALTALGITSLF